MVRDRYGFQHESGPPSAIAAFERAVHGVASHRPSSGEALVEALAADPELPAAWALKGFASVILAREELTPVAVEACARASLGIEARGGSADERSLVGALRLATKGRLLAAADLLDGHLGEAPGSFIHAKLSHALRFMAGDVRGMLRTTSLALASSRSGDPGFGFLLGCHAFGLEENGEFARAERLGREAVSMEPDDVWGIHAVGHVFEMQGRTSEGIGWIESHRPVWSACNNFSFHMAWHLALFHLERADHEAALSRYDCDVRPESTNDFRDMANAISFLWRLRLEGVDVGHRWDELRLLAAMRRRDTTLAFASLHNLLALTATGDLAAAHDLLGSLAVVGRQTSASRRPDQQAVIGRIGLDLAQIIVDLGENRTKLRSSCPLGLIAIRLPEIGGSHAQRDVFLQTLAMAAADSGNDVALAQILAARRRFKKDDRFAALVGARLAAVAAPGRLSA